MQKFSTLADAIALAEFAHRNQLDKAGLPYIEHPKRVLETVKSQSVAPYVQMAAILHDVPEDTRFSHDILLSLGFSEAVVNLTKLLDRDYSAALHASLITKCFARKQYRDGWSQEMEMAWKFPVEEFYYQQIKANRDATIVKLADIRDNMQGWRLAYLSDESQKRLRAKYTKALEILNPAPINHGFISGYVHDPYMLG